MNNHLVKQSSFAYFWTSNPKLAPFWFIVRLYLGWEWLSAGWEKVMNPAWFGANAGSAIQGFVQGALAKTGGVHPDVQWWYASFLQHAVLPHSLVWANFVAIGEVLVGLGLIVGFLTAAAAFFGFLMNLDYLLAGTVSVNPIMLVLALGIMLAHRISGLWGLDGVVKRLYRNWFPKKTTSSL
jgi:thiosulfate dehydrogenase [quinone] large subunit